MTAIILTCTRCGSEVKNEVGEWAITGICSTCYIRETVAPYQTEMIRLWRKFSRYVGNGINVDHLNDQIRAKFNRALKKAHDAAPEWPAGRIVDLCTQILITDAQSAAAGYSKRILRPNAPQTSN